MRVLVACECSGRVKTAFRERGHDAWSCDIKPSEIPDDKYHIQDDVMRHLRDGWDLMIAHPDCTYLCNSGVRWLTEKAGRWDAMRKAAYFFRGLLQAEIPKIAIENPIPHKYTLVYIGKKYDELIQPWQFGDAESKATCLWLKGLPLLLPTYPKPLAVNQSVWKEGLGPDRKANRARTFQGIANAMAEQWGNL